MDTLQARAKISCLQCHEEMIKGNLPRHLRYHEQVREYRDEAIRLYHEGMDKKSIHQRLKISLRAVNEIVKNEPPVEELKHTKTVRQYRRQVRKLYRMGLQRYEIHRDLDITFRAVCEILEGLPIPEIQCLDCDRKIPSNHMKTHREWHEEMEPWIEPVVRLHTDEGKSVEMIRKELDISSLMVRQILEDEDLIKPKCEICNMRIRGGSIFNKHMELHEKFNTSLVLQWHNEGVSQEAIRKRLGCGKDMVQTFLQGVPHVCPECGVEVSGGAGNLKRHIQKEHRDKKRREELLRMYADGKSMNEIADHCGIARRTVSEVLREAGVDTDTKLRESQRANCLSRVECPKCGITIRASNLERHLDARHTEGIRFFTPHDQEILRLYDAHISMKKIAKQLKISNYQVRQCLIAHGVERHDPSEYEYGRIDQLEMDRTIYLYTQKDLTMNEIGELMGISSGAVNHRLKRAGVTLRTREETGALLKRRRIMAKAKAARAA